MTQQTPLTDYLTLTYRALSAAQNGQPISVTPMLADLGAKYPDASPVRLQRAFGLSPLQLYAILVSYALYHAPTSGRNYSTVSQNSILPTVGHCTASFAPHLPRDWFCSFSPDFLRLCFLPPSYDMPSLAEYHLILPPELVYFLEDTAFVSPPYLCNIQPLACAQTSRYTLPPHTILYLYGASGSGRLHFVRTSLMPQSDIWLCSLSALLALELAKRQYAGLLLLRLTILEQKPLCFSDCVLEQIKQQDILWLCRLFTELHEVDAKIILFGEEPLPPAHLLCRRFSMISHTPPALTFSESKALWEAQGKDIDGTALAERFHFLPGQIRQIVRQTTPCTTETYLQACREHAHTIPLIGVRFLEPQGTWDDLILAKREKNILRHACDYIHHSATVYEDWGFGEKLPYGRNLSILMEGPPGTGKTMAAGILANDLGLPLLHLNTAQVLSRYIGETEKQLKQVFTLAEQANAILLIDEMDVLFGKRAQIKDAHDKYANMQTSFLLQQIESFRGILLLTTNFLTNVDEAFLRRIQFVVHFALPTETERFQIWRSMFPPSLPFSEHVDFAFLAKQFPLSGGEIKNIVLHAAFLAAGKQTWIDMQILLQAVQSTLRKQGKVLLRQDFGEYGYLLETETI